VTKVTTLTCFDKRLTLVLNQPPKHMVPAEQPAIISKEIIYFKAIWNYMKSSSTLKLYVDNTSAGIALLISSIYEAGDAERLIYIIPFALAWIPSSLILR
jgi:hypothetical protein